MYNIHFYILLMFFQIGNSQLFILNLLPIKKYIENGKAFQTRLQMELSSHFIPYHLNIQQNMTPGKNKLCIILVTRLKIHIFL